MRDRHGHGEIRFSCAAGPTAIVIVFFTDGIDIAFCASVFALIGRPLP
jgi:hypothetical protein